MTDDDEDAVRVLSRGQLRPAEVDPDFERELAELLLEPREAGPPGSSGVPAFSVGEGQVEQTLTWKGAATLSWSACHSMLGVKVPDIR